MNFSLSDDEKALQETAKKFAREVMRPRAAHCDEKNEFPKEIIEQAWQLGLLNMTIAPEYGGVGLTHTAQALVCEELAWGCSGMTTSIIANDLALLPIEIGGTPEQKERFLRPFTEKFMLASFALTEPGAGSDVVQLLYSVHPE